MKNSTLLRFLFALFAAAAIACAPNPLYAQRGGHGGGGGGGGFHGGGGGGFHGGGGGFHGGSFGGGGHYSGGGRASNPYRGGGYAGAPRSYGSYYGHPGGYSGNHTFYNGAHSYGANSMGARRFGAVPPSSVHFGPSSSFRSFGNRPGSMNVARGPQGGWHSFGPPANSSAARFSGNPRSPSLTANRPLASGPRASNSRNWAGQGHSLWASAPRPGSFSGSAISTNRALSSIRASHSNSLFASNARFNSSAALHNGMRLGGPLQVHPGAGFRSGFTTIYGSPHPFNQFGYRGFGTIGIGNRGWGGYGYRGWGGFGRRWGGWGCYGCGFGWGWGSGWGWGWGLGWGLGWGWGPGIGFGWGNYWNPGWGWGGYWGYPYGPSYYDPWYWNGGFYSYPTLDYNLLDSNIPGYTSDDSGNYNDSSNSLNLSNPQPYDSNSSTGQSSADIENNSAASSSGSLDANPPTNNVAASAPTVLLYLHDGTTITASDYWIENNEIHYTVDYGTGGTISLNDFDLQRTVDENAKRGVTFTLRPNPDTTTAAPSSTPDAAPSTSAAPSQN